MSLSDEVQLLKLQDSVKELSRRLANLTSRAALQEVSHRNNLLYGVPDVNGLHPISSGDTAYMILCSVLVIMMTIPGLGLYYAGMVRVQSVLPTVMQSFSITCTITLVWLFWGYSLVMGPAGMPDSQGHRHHSSPFIGTISLLRCE